MSSDGPVLTHRPPLGRAVVRYPALEAPQGLSADALAQDLVLLAEWLGHGTREVAVYRATGGVLAGRANQASSLRQGFFSF